jgi:hypothetical protein
MDEVLAAWALIFRAEIMAQGGANTRPQRRACHWQEQPQGISALDSPMGAAPEWGGVPIELPDTRYL